MNPTLLKDLILAGHRVACKSIEWKRIVFLFINWMWKFEWTQQLSSIKSCLYSWLNNYSYSKEEIQDFFTWEYKIVTPLPQLPQVWDTVEVLEICRELPWFDEWNDNMKYMVWKKYKVTSINIIWWVVQLWIYIFPMRAVAKCEPDVEPTPVSEEKFWQVIELNWKKYREII